MPEDIKLISKCQQHLPYGSGSHSVSKSSIVWFDENILEVFGSCWSPSMKSEMHELRRKHCPLYTNYVLCIPRKVHWGSGHLLRLPETLQPTPHLHFLGTTVEVAKLTLSPNRCLGFIACVSGPSTATDSFFILFHKPQVCGIHRTIHFSNSQFMWLRASLSRLGPPP